MTTDVAITKMKNQSDINENTTGNIIRSSQSLIDANNNAIRTQQSIRQLHYGNTIIVFLFDLKLLLLK